MLASPFSYCCGRSRLPATAAAATTVAATAATVAATAAVLARTRFVHGQGAALQVGAVEGGDSRLRLRLVRHLHEAEAPCPAGVPVGRDAGAGHGAVRGKCRFQIPFGRVKTKVANVNVQDIVLLSLSPDRARMVTDANSPEPSTRSGETSSGGIRESWR